MKFGKTSKKVAAKAAAQMSLASAFLGLGALNIGAASAALAFTGAGTPVAAVTGAVALGAALSSGVFALGSSGMGWAADDPPREDYQSTTIFDQKKLSHHSTSSEEFNPAFHELCECLAHFTLSLEGCVKSIERCSGIELAMQGGKSGRNGEDLKALKFMQIEALRYNARACAECTEHLLSITPLFNIRWFEQVSKIKNGPTERKPALQSKAVLDKQHLAYLKSLGLEQLALELRLQGTWPRQMQQFSSIQQRDQMPHLLFEEEWYEALEDWRSEILGSI